MHRNLAPERNGDPFECREGDVLTGLDAADVLHGHVEKLGESFLGDLPLPTKIGDLPRHAPDETLFAHADRKAR